MGTLAACSSDKVPVPEGNWDLTLTWTTGNCAGLGATYHINFDISKSGGVFVFVAGTGLTGDTVGGTMVCDSAFCTLDFTDSGPGSVLSNIDTQTISATLDEDVNDIVTGTGTATFDLTDGSSCSQNFNADGDVI